MQGKKRRVKKSGSVENKPGSASAPGHAEESAGAETASTSLRIAKQGSASSLFKRKQRSNAQPVAQPTSRPIEEPVPPPHKTFANTDATKAEFAPSHEQATPADPKSVRVIEPESGRNAPVSSTKIDTRKLAQDKVASATPAAPSAKSAASAKPAPSSIQSPAVSKTIQPNVAASPAPAKPASATPPKGSGPDPTRTAESVKAKQPVPASPKAPSAPKTAAAESKVIPPQAKAAAPSLPKPAVTGAPIQRATTPARASLPARPITPVKPILWLPPILQGRSPLEVLRPDDLVSFYVNFVNLRLDTSNTRDPKLVIQDVSVPAYLVVWFAPQSILEEAYFETAKITANPGFDGTAPPLPTSPDNPPTPGTVRAYIAGQSRLVFEVPASVKAIPYTIGGLLDWSKFDLVVSPVALGKPMPPPITSPTFLQTAIEIPWRIVLSPEKGVGWAHASEPETFAGRTALWHTRLGKIETVTSGKTKKQVLQEASLTNTLPLRAIWSDDFTDHGPIPLLDQEIPFRSSLDPHDRMQIVILTSGTLGYTIPSAYGPGAEWTPVPTQASRLFLSPLGGYLASRGSWDLLPSYTDTAGNGQGLDLLEWNHEATLGRDQYVRVVYAGYLYPFGHAASLIKVTERKFVPPDGINVTQVSAYLRQHMYIVVREPQKSYGGEPYQYHGLENPFWQNVQIKTKVTPDIDIPVMLTGDGNAHQSFWVTVGGENFQFHMEATDLAGNKIDFLAPLVFLSNDEGHPAGVQSIYAGNDAVRVCTVNGRKIAYADPNAGDTTLRTTELYFTTEIELIQPPYPISPFIPTLDKATVTVPALEQILGTNTPLSVQLYSGYLQNGLDSNAGVYVAIQDPQPNGNPQPEVAFNAGQSGGFSTPTIVMTALSARKGLIAGDAADAAAGKINPKEFFDITAKLFGAIPLQALIPVDSAGLAPAAQNAPEIRTVLQPNPKQPTSTITKIQWSPQLQDFEQDPLKITFNQTGPSALNLRATLTRNMTGGPPSSSIYGQLTNFQINLLGVITLIINSIKFTSSNGQKLNVVAKLPSNSPIQFIGPLSFVQKLAEILPPGIFGGDGPSIDLEPSEIVVSYTLGLPPASIGVFSLENISITVGLDLPYLDGTPGFEFAFAKRSSPFLITVECLGGGGFVHLIVNANGVQMVEGSLEFGGEFSIDLGVASGSVHAMAGIYFKLTGTSTDLTGFVDIGGEVSVLGIISISIDLNLSLSYETSNNKSFVQGRATLTIGVHILFFSLSVSVSVERSFGANPGDPRVENVLTAQDWSQYAAAFA